MTRHLIPCCILLMISLLIGAIVPVVIKDANWIHAWLSFAFILFISALALYAAWCFLGRNRVLGWFLASAFLIRIVVGLITEAGLPLWGFDETVQKSGYLFYDAYKRDNDAWALAKSNQSLLSAFGNEFVGDQYGGLLSLSALIYRTLSTDYHRPYLVMLLTALAGSLAIAFVWGGACTRWGKRVAIIAAGLVAFFPDAILFGASQMREPFLVFGIALAFWGIVHWKDHRKWTILAISVSVITLFLISFRAAMPALAVLAGWFVLDRIPKQGNRKMELLLWGGIVVAAILLAVISWNWLISSSSWDILETIKTSGRVQYVFESIPEKYQVPFVIAYGLTRPVLPAAIVDPSLPIWRIIAILRGVGWYGIAPLLVYSIIVVWKAKEPADRRILAWLSICVVIWLLVSSARAGGDDWDNPRYRSIFLVYITLLCGWAWDYFRRNKDAWLGRFYLIEAIFLGFFLEWYISRYYQVVGRLPFEEMLIWVAGLAMFVIIGGIVWDRIKITRTVRG
jgi:4-amino-4-deoxy-L-arabinose transferase-like glycosyltransferase